MLDIGGRIKATVQISTSTVPNVFCSSIGGEKGKYDTSFLKAVVHDQNNTLVLIFTPRVFHVNFCSIEGFNSPWATFFPHKLEERSEDWNIKSAARV